MTKDQLIHEIGSKLAADIGSRKKDWAHMVLVGTIERDEPEISGFAYYKNGKHEPVAPRDFSILELLSKLRKTMAADDKNSPWRTSLIRVDRDSGEITFKFEYDKPGRWVINLKNSEERASELSPFKT